MRPVAGRSCLTTRSSLPAAGRECGRRVGRTILEPRAAPGTVPGRLITVRADVPAPDSGLDPPGFRVILDVSMFWTRLAAVACLLSQVLPLCAAALRCPVGPPARNQPGCVAVVRAGCSASCGAAERSASACSPTRRVPCAAEQLRSTQGCAARQRAAQSRSTCLSCQVLPRDRACLAECVPDELRAMRPAVAAESAAPCPLCACCIAVGPALPVVRESRAGVAFTRLAAALRPWISPASARRVTGPAGADAAGLWLLDSHNRRQAGLSSWLK